MIVLRTSPLALALAVMGTPTLAQQQPLEYLPLEVLEFSQVSHNTIDIPASIGGSGPLGRMVAGDLTGNELTSGALLVGGVPALVYAPDHFHVVAELPSSGTLHDLTLLERPAGEADELIGVGSQGLVRYVHDPETGEFTEELFGSSLWNDAVRVRAASLGPDGDPYLIGLSADRLLVLIAELHESGPPTESWFSLNADGLAMVDADWDGDGERDLVVATARRLKAFDLQGNTIDSIRTAFPGGAVERLEAWNGPNDAVAWIVRSGDDAFYQLMILSQGVFDETEIVPLYFSADSATPAQAISVLGLLQGDCDGDGDTDLVVPQADFHQLITLRRRGSPSSVVAGPPYTVQAEDVEQHPLTPLPASPAPLQEGLPAFRDIDHDPYGTDDLLIPVEATRGILVVRGEQATEPTEPGDPETTPVAPLPAPADPFHVLHWYEPGPNEGEFSLVLANLPSWILNAYDHAQITVWVQSGGSGEITARAIQNELYELEQVGGVDWPNHQFLVPIPEELLLWGDRRYFIRIRLVEASTAGPGAPSILASSPAFAGALILPHDGTDPLTDTYFDDLVNRPGAGDPLDVLPGESPLEVDLIPLIGNQRVGVIVPQNLMPPAPMNVAPYAGPLVFNAQRSLPWGSN